MVDGIADIAVRAPWAAERFLLDLTLVSSSAGRAAASTVDVALQAARQRKFNRYGVAMIPLAFSDRGRSEPGTMRTLSLLAELAAEVGQDSQPPGRILRCWRRSLDVARVAAMSETRMAMFGGVALARIFTLRDPRPCPELPGTALPAPPSRPAQLGASRAGPDGGRARCSSSSSSGSSSACRSGSCSSGRSSRSPAPSPTHPRTPSSASS